MSERIERTPLILRLAGYPRYRVLAGGFSHWEYYDQVVDREAEAMTAELKSNAKQGDIADG